MFFRRLINIKIAKNNLNDVKVILRSYHPSISLSNSTLSSNRIGFVGTGKIAQSIISGLIKKDIFKPEQIYVSDANAEYLEYLKEKTPFFQVGFNFFIIYKFYHTVKFIIINKRDTKLIL